MRHANSNSDGNIHTHANGNADHNGDADAYPYGYIDTHAEVRADSEASPHTGASPIAEK